MSLLLLGAGAVRAIARRGIGSNATGTTASSVVDKPTGTVQNDVIVVQLCAGVETNTFSAPDGTWTRRVGALPSGSERIEVWFKVAGDAEPATYTFTQSGAGPWSGQSVAYSGVSGADPVPAGSAGSKGEPVATTTITSDTITPGSNNMMLLVFGFVDDASSTTWTEQSGAMTELWDFQEATSFIGIAAYEQLLSGGSGVGITRQLNLSASDELGMAWACLKTG